MNSEELTLKIKSTAEQIIQDLNDVDLSHDEKRALYDSFMAEIGMSAKAYNYAAEACPACNGTGHKDGKP